MEVLTDPTVFRYPLRAGCQGNDRTIYRSNWNFESFQKGREFHRNYLSRLTEAIGTVVGMDSDLGTVVDRMVSTAVVVAVVLLTTVDHMVSAVVVVL